VYKIKMVIKLTASKIIEKLKNQSKS